MRSVAAFLAILLLAGCDPVVEEQAVQAKVIGKFTTMESREESIDIGDFHTSYTVHFLAYHVKLVYELSEFALDADEASYKALGEGSTVQVTRRRRQSGSVWFHWR